MAAVIESGITFLVADKPLEKVKNNFNNSLLKDGGPREIIAKSPQQDSRVDKVNGFVSAITQAYNRHHHLILRPDDVWIAIMVQFSAFMEQNGEEVRKKFVDHEDKKELNVDGGGTLATADYAGLSMRMAEQIAKNIKDPSVKEWVIPSFSTTTATDRVVGAIALMSAMKKFFSYKFSLCCGIPKVTLEGTVADWKNLEQRAARLLEFDVKSSLLRKWLALLAPVLAQFSLSAEGKPNLEWWNRVCSDHGGGSGPSYLSGWITVFCVFDDSGKWVGDQRSVQHYMGKALCDVHQVFAPEGWPILDTNDIPSGCCSVDLTIDDNGKEYKCSLTAGHSAMLVPDEVTVRPGVEWSLQVKTPSAVSMMKYIV